MTIYPVFERFATFQGEGVHMGKPAFFVRLHGCPVHCPWCDSAGTWHKDWVPYNIAKMAPLDIAHEVSVANMDMVVVTGGEPTVYDLEDLVTTLRQCGNVIHLETSGAFPIKGLFDWVTLSPKKWKHPIEASIMLADEFKVIVEHPDDIEFYWTLLLCNGLPADATTPIWLHPEWSHRDDPEVISGITAAVKAGGGIFRAGWQLHKLYRVDMLDERSRAPVPLGGDPAKGL